MEPKTNNFDKEFSLNQKKRKKKAPRGKLPSWLMILAGIAVIGGVIAARQPALHSLDTGTRTTVNLPATQMVSGEHIVFNSVNDEQVNSSELEARFLSQGEQAAQAQLSESTPAVLSAEPTAETGIVSPEAEPKAAEEEEKEAPAPEKEVPAENSTVAWLNEKAYSVSVKPGDETAPSGNEHRTESVNVPVTVLDSNGNAKRQPQTTTFTLGGKEYALQLTELSPEDIPEEKTDQPVVWIDKTPLQVTLSNDTTAPVAMTEDGTAAEQPVEISLSPLTTDQTAALQIERFGTDYTKPAVPLTESTPTPTVEPTALPTEEPQEENWFASFFNNIFGSDPTATPTPQVTVIAITPTATMMQPTATPLIIRMAPTLAAEGPVRLDGSGNEAADSTAETKTTGETDPALLDVDQNSDGSDSETAQTDLQPTKAAPSKIDAVVVDSFDKTEKTKQPEVQPTPAELPHTGGLEGWNIPSLIAMLGGLILVIIGVRRLRTR